MAYSYQIRKHQSVLGIESDVSPEHVKDSSADQRIFNNKWVEEWRRLHDDVAQENVVSARDVSRQLPQVTSRNVGGRIVCRWHNITSFFQFPSERSSEIDGTSE